MVVLCIIATIIVTSLLRILVNKVAGVDRQKLARTLNNVIALAILVVECIWLMQHYHQVWGFAVFCVIITAVIVVKLNGEPRCSKCGSCNLENEMVKETYRKKLLNYDVTVWFIKHSDSDYEPHYRRSHYYADSEYDKHTVCKDCGHVERVWHESHSNMRHLLVDARQCASCGCINDDSLGKITVYDRQGDVVRGHYEETCGRCGFHWAKDFEVTAQPMSEEAIRLFNERVDVTRKQHAPRFVDGTSQDEKRERQAERSRSCQTCAFYYGGTSCSMSGSDHDIRSADQRMVGHAGWCSMWQYNPGR